MEPNQIPLDYTGYGPTGTGYRPTAGAMRRQAENKYRTDRNSEMMQYVDPSVNAAVDLYTKPFYEANSDPAEVRRKMFDDPKAQAARDVAMYQRRNGMLGHGDPVNYSHNITRGVTAGGFTTDVIGKDPGGRSVLGMDQRVQGNGLLAERVTQNFQKGLLDDMYGKDQIADPSKTNGFDMEEVSGVAGTIMRRGGIGKAATLVHGADAQTRLDAARDAATPEMQEKLAGIKLGKGEDGQKELERLAETTKDPKLQKELGRLAKSTDAVVVNDGAHKKVAGVVKEVTKGMAALADMYGELSASELHQTLESITGQKIVNKQQAKAATNMVNNMRNSAEDLGMDPRAFMDMAAQNQANAHQQYMNAGGFDGRSGTETKATSTKISNKNTQEAAAAAVQQEQAAKDGEALGIDMSGTTKSVDEIALDLQQQTTLNQERSRGEAMVRGGLDKITNKDTRKQAEELLAKKDASTDAGERSNYEDQLKALAGRQWGGKSQTFEAADASNTGRAFKNKGYADDKQIAAAEAADMAALNTSNIDDLTTEKLGLKQEEATKFSKTLVKKLGGTGMVDVAKIAMQPDQVGDQKITAKDRKEQVHNYLTKTAKMSEDEARDYESKMINDETGKFKDEEMAKDMTQRVGQTSWGGQSEAQKTKTTEKALADRGRNSSRSKVSGDDGKVTIGSITDAIIKKRVGGIDNPETMALTLQAMKDEGMTSLMTDATDADGKTIAYQDAKDVDTYRQTDLSKGVTKEALTKLTAANGGKSLNLAAKLGYKTDEEMAEKTAKDPKALADAKRLIDKDSDYDKFNSAGTDKTKKVNLMDGFETGIDLSKNISEKSVEQLTKVNGGKDLGLLKKFGYKDNAEMAEKTKNADERTKVLQYLDESTDMTLTGDAGNTTAISDATSSAALNMKDGPAAVMRKLSAATALNGGLKGSESSAVTAALKNNDIAGANSAVDSALKTTYTADKVGKKSSEGGLFSGYGGRQFTHMDNNRNFVNAAQNINEADDGEMKNIAELNKDGSFGKSMEAQLKSLKEAKAGGMDTVISRDPVTGKEVTNNTDDSIAKLEAAIAKLSGATATANGQQVIPEMRVTNLHIDNVADLKKS